MCKRRIIALLFVHHRQGSSFGSLSGEDYKRIHAYSLRLLIDGLRTARSKYGATSAYS